MSNKNGYRTQVITVDGHSMVGGPTHFYVYIRGLNKSAGWFTGNDAFKIWFKLKSLSEKDKAEFILQLRRLHDENPKL